MNKTVKLYDRNAYDTEFDAIVVACLEKVTEKGKYCEIVLNETLFFPEEGGQSPDQGQLNQQDVLDVQIREGIIYHTVASEITVGTKVHGVVNWQHRFFNMQQHSGEHIFSGLVYERYGFRNVGFHLSDQIVTMDFDGVLSEEQIEEIEWAVNQAIAENIEIQVSFPTREELQSLVYRSKMEIEGQVRIVTIPGYDVCACCAPHVKRTGEIGMLKVMTVQNYKGGIRVTILCGFRALEAMRQKNKIVAELVGVLTTNQDNLVESVSRLKAQNQTLSIQLGQAKQSLLEQKLASIPEEQENVLVFESDLDTKIVRNIVNGLCEKHSGLCGIFIGDDLNGYSYILGSKNINCKEIGDVLREKVGAKGGGSPQMIQGSLQANKNDVLKILLDR